MAATLVSSPATPWVPQPLRRRPPPSVSGIGLRWRTSHVRPRDVLPRPTSMPFFGLGLRRGVFIGAWSPRRPWRRPCLIRMAAPLPYSPGWVLVIVLLAYRFQTWRPTVPGSTGLSNCARAVWTAAALVTALLIVYLPSLQGVLGSAALPWRAWGVAILITELPVGLGGRLAPSPK